MKQADQVAWLERMLPMAGANKVQTFGKFEKVLGWYHQDINAALS